MWKYIKITVESCLDLDGNFGIYFLFLRIVITPAVNYIYGPGDPMEDSADEPD